VLRTKFRPRREEITGEWRKLRDDEFMFKENMTGGTCNMHESPNIYECILIKWVKQTECDGVYCIESA
jgi:hypothetical protein